LKHHNLHRYLNGCAILLVLLFSGCAATIQMQMSPKELQRASPNDGLVIGSLLIKGGWDIFGRSRFELTASNRAFAGPDYSIQASRNGTEVVFVTKLPAGEYSFHELEQPGFSSFRAHINVRFDVRAGQTTYIGRMVIEFPPGLITIFTIMEFIIEDAKAATIVSANSQLGFYLNEESVPTELMELRQVVAPK
jgi:hypothetical protein